jgi:hypothetical protein
MYIILVGGRETGRASAGTRRKSDCVSGRDINYMGYNNKVLDKYVLSVLSFPEQMRKCNVLDLSPAW